MTVASTPSTRPDHSPYENVTFSIGFEPDTFTERDSSYFAAGFPALTAIGQPARQRARPDLDRVARALTDACATAADGRRSSPSTSRPKASARCSPRSSSAEPPKGAAAQLVDFAVNKRMRIIENPDTGCFSTTSYTLQLLDARGLHGPELNLAQAVFGYSLQPGAAYTIQRQGHGTEPAGARGARVDPVHRQPSTAFSRQASQRRCGCRSCWPWPEQPAVSGSASSCSTTPSGDFCRSCCCCRASCAP